MKAKRVKLSQQIRQQIDGSGLTRYRISKLTGIPQSTLSKFMAGKLGLSMEVLDTLADALLLNITAETKPEARAKRKR